MQTLKKGVGKGAFRGRAGYSVGRLAGASPERGRGKARHRQQEQMSWGMSEFGQCSCSRESEELGCTK